MDILQYSTPNKNTGRNGWIPDMICCHITEGSFGGSINWLLNPSVKASAHFIVAKDGRVAQLVDIADTAWCNGTNNTPGDSRNNALSTLPVVRDRKTNANFYTISIEHEGKHSDTQGALTDAQMAATIKLMAYIKAEVKRLYSTNMIFDRNHIVGHYEINPRTKPNCPGKQFPFDEIIRQLQLMDGPQPKPAWETTVDNLLADGVIADGQHWRGYLSGSTTTTAEFVKTVFDRYHALLTVKKG